MIGNDQECFSFFKIGDNIAALIAGDRAKVHYENNRRESYQVKMSKALRLRNYIEKIAL